MVREVKREKPQLIFPDKIPRTQRGYYFDVRLHDYLIAEAARHEVSTNILLGAIIDFYRTNCSGTENDNISHADFTSGENVDDDE